MKSETFKLPRGQFYPLKPSRLEAVLRLAGVDIDVHLIRSPGQLFDAHFWPPTPNVEYERLYIRAGSVSAELAHAARIAVETNGLPTVLQWAQRILQHDPASPVRREQHSITFLDVSTLPRERQSRPTQQSPRAP